MDHRFVQILTYNHALLALWHEAAVVAVAVGRASEGRGR